MSFLYEIFLKAYRLAVFAIVFLTLVGEGAAQEGPPRISVAYCVDCVPFQFTDEDLRPAGMIIDHWRLWSKKTGISVQYVEAKWDETIRMVAEGRADAHAGLFFNKTRDTILDYGVALARTETQAFIHASLPPIRKLQDIMAYRVGVLTGDYVEGYLRGKIPGADIVGFRDYGAIIDALKDGRLRAFAADTETALFHLKRSGLANDYPIANSQLLYQNDWFVAAGEGNAALLEIINRGMEQISTAEKRRIARRWGPDRDKDSEGGLLTADERKWIRDHLPFRLGVDPAWPPFDYVDAQGLHLGFSADILRLLQHRLKTSFELTPGLTWSQVLERAEARTIDLISICAPTAQREKYLRFTRPITSMPWVVVTRKDFPKFKDLNDLADYDVTMTVGYAVVDLSQSKFPNVPVRQVGSPLDGLRAVAVGKADAYVDNLGVVNHLMQENALSNLRIAGDSGLPHQPLMICVRSDWPELVTILNKGLEDLPSDEIRSILRKWIPIEIGEAVIQRQESIPQAVWWLSAVAIIAILSLVVVFRVLMRSSSEENLALQFGSSRFRGFVIAALGLFVLVVVFAGWLAMVHNHEKILATVRGNLQTVLNTTSERLSDWVTYRKLVLAEFGRESELLEIAERLLKVPAQRESLLASEPLVEMRRFFDKNHKRFGNLGFSIINADAISMASRRDTNIGTANLIGKYRPDLLRRVFEGETVFIPPLHSDAASAKTDVKKPPPSMYFATPIRRSDGKVIAALTQRIDPSRDFTRVLQLGRLGETGESYAFDRQGLLMSNSRFEEDLRKIGVIGPDQKSMLNIHIRDPGGNMVEGYRPSLLLGELPLTRMADSAIRGETDVDTKGYLDYRGVPVFGAWTWESALGLGLATEIDIAEALSPFYTMRLTAVSVLGLVLFLTVSAVLFSLNLGERANQALIKARDELEQRVIDRTRELEKSETRFRTIIDNASDGIVVINDKGIIQNFSPAAELIFGYTADEIVGENVKTLMIDPDRGRHDGYIKRYHESREARIVGTNREVMGLHKDGHEFPMDLAVSEATFGDERIFTGIIRDITERKEADRINQERTHLMQAILGSMDQGLVAFDKDLKLASWNHKFLEIRNYPEDLMEEGKDFADFMDYDLKMDEFIHEDRILSVEEQVERAKKFEHHHFERQRRDGSYIEVLGGPIPGGGFVSTFSDITERKRAELDLQGAFNIISSSIDYASRIQRSVLPSGFLFSSLLSDHFVIWEPRDVVGGDIYWTRLWGDGLLVVLGDCTGHGVPGAFMTLIATGALDKALTEVVHGQIGALLQRIHQLVQITLKQHTNKSQSDDGMELGVCYLSPEMDKITFSGARFELHIIEDGRSSIIKGTKSGIGYHGILHDQSFEEHQLTDLEKKSFYMTSDGLTDQIGGEKGRMFGKNRFKKLLLSIQDKTMPDQKQAILRALQDYQGDQNRRDDVSLVGFRI